MSVKAIAVNPDAPESFIEVTQPMPQPGDYDLLVEVKAVSINPVDTKVHASLQKNGLQEPRVLGWDASGIVTAMGSKVSGFKAGDEVYYAGDITRPGSNASHQLIDARIVGHKPRTLSWAAAAAIPLTALTAWEGLFERLNIQDAGEDKTLLIIGGAGGVGSLAIPFARLRSKVKIIATASREDSAQWCRDRGADLVVNYRDLPGELAQHDIKFVDYIFILNDTDGHWAAVSQLIAPQGHICSIVENAHPLDQDALKSKSAALHWEFMYTRSMYQTADMARQGEILNEVAKLVEAGEVESALSETFHGLSVESITNAHRKVLEGHMRGKVVVAF
ncbi:zinc-binding alcohol dehydrogenase family protein [Cronobacter dublinensis]|uniref:Zinc-type alcohol dehydrogenase-like protein n=1 Tax=Cronobacter dublinensis 1210 TaxID=1208656 RepID=A0ABP1W5P7_9ENTR|nr:zinc-binding alcohol dehydrogenase family protein [Cronobacter dublinensis]CCJ80549.1 Bifunctional protein: zinc-containing alcohol dehydrogenase; quinone oxidoreductase (NADPH:quinone reductase); Similar to arginate lyase [Cronobacter dublinensis 1210]ALB65519.1 NADPH:quinone reductase [Cronobacter dublinensis subsp. dublinensis LMG 23823]EGT4381221.1 zinc-binding alcohol dehydrogenase family protein [Cronobacter dublinensis]EKM6458972.1 zinc-binding alcohol dehydrogenase family protein [Cr